MHDSSRALLKRGSIAAATALVIGSSFMAAPAIATAIATPEPTSSESAAVPSPESSTAPDVATLPEGLEEAVERDLGISIEEFYENGELNEVVETLSKELKQAKLVADFAIADKKINVTVAASSLKAVTEKLDELTKDTGVEVDIVAEEEAETKVDTSSAPVADASGEAKASIAPEATAPSTAETKASSTPKSKDLKVAESPKIKAEVAPEIEAKANPKNVDALLAAYVAAVEPEAVSQLQAIMKSSDGTFVIRTGGVAETEKKKTSDSPKASSLRFSDKLTAEEFAEQYTKVTLEVAEGPAKSAASTDVLGGMGYGAPNATGYSVCSIGFTGFNAGGDNAAISAGHCAHDGDITDVQILEHSAPDEFSRPGEALGTFGFSQFGGPKNSSVTGLDDAQSVDDLGNIGTDVSVIDQINPALSLKALVTDWSTPDVRDSSTKVTGVAAAVAGTDICKSGRTTGWTCGTVDEVGIFLVGGHNGAGDDRAVRGFGMSNPIVDEKYTKAFEGDSGGSVIAGGTAVGVTSAIGEVVVRDEDGNIVKGEDDKPVTVGRAYFTDIVDALNHTDGYSIAMFLNAPVVKAPAQGTGVAAGSTITGTVAGAPTGSTVKVMSGGKKVADAKVPPERSASRYRQTTASSTSPCRPSRDSMSRRSPQGRSTSLSAHRSSAPRRTPQRLTPRFRPFRVPALSEQRLLSLAMRREPPLWMPTESGASSLPPRCPMASTRSRLRRQRAAKPLRQRPVPSLSSWFHRPSPLRPMARPTPPPGRRSRVPALPVPR